MQQSHGDHGEWKGGRGYRAAGCGPVRRAAALLVAAALAGCSSYGPQGIAPGTPAGEVVRRMGPPTAVHPLPAADGARRLEYARGPAGKHTWFLDFDGEDRLLRSRQVLTEPHFATIRAGMSSAEVRARLGRPAQVWALPMQRQQVWSYRFESPFCRWFMVGVGLDGRVADTSYGPDPACTPLED